MSEWQTGAEVAAQIFLSAEVYHASSGLLGAEGTRDKPQFFFASITCAAFAAELYLKALIAAEQETFKAVYEHDLWELFNKNIKSQETKQKIRDLYNSRTTTLQQAILQSTGVKRDFDAVIQFGKDAFELMRYSFEPGQRDHGWDGNGIINAIRDVALELQPTWPVPNGARPTFPAR
ncbi:MAG: hypothetical protein ACJ8F3_07040 [Xanthobacteraceae bacterium]